MKAKAFLMPRVQAAAKAFGTADTLASLDELAAELAASGHTDPPPAGDDDEDNDDEDNDDGTSAGDG